MAPSSGNVTSLLEHTFPMSIFAATSAAMKL